MMIATIRRPARAMDPGPDSGRPRRSPGYFEMPEVSGPVSQEPMSLRSTTVQVYRVYWTDQQARTAQSMDADGPQCGHRIAFTYQGVM
jgi:hypothetical protein